MKSTVFKILIFAFLGVFLITFRAYDLGHYLTLENLKSQQLLLQGYFAIFPKVVISLYILIYILAAAFSLPGATVLTLGGGLIFGFWLGTAIVSIASTIGATIAFLISRFLLRNFVQKKFGDKLAIINEGVKREGAFYLFTMRLIPVFPFFLINLVMGLTPIKTLTFFFVSLVGMLAGTAAYVNAGTQLGQIESLSGILSPQLLLSLVFLGVLPLISKFAIARFRENKLLRGFLRPRRFDYNLVVIGGGSAGLVSAYIASALKAKVALIEKQKMGGDCLNTGCVPSKALIRSAKILSYIKRSKEFGFKNAEVEFDFAEVMDRVRRVIAKIEPHDSVERYRNLGVHCIQGEAKIQSPYSVEVNGRTLSTRAIVVATGACPLVPPIAGLEKIKYFTSETIWNIRSLPQRMVVLGGGPIGCELAQCFHRFGSEVSLVEMASQLLVREDSDVSDLIEEKFKREGVNILTSHRARSFETANGKNILVLDNNGRERLLEFDTLLLALGRKPNTKGFGLEELGVHISPRGTIASNDFLATNYPNIYVCGDVAGPYQFTHTAAHQAWYASINALLSPFKRFKTDYRVIPWCTFTDPEVARVGLNEKEAQEKGMAYSVTKYEMSDLDRAIADEEDHGFIKVITPPGKDTILGATIVGSHAGDIISEYVAAMKHGFGMNKILSTIHIYPTLAEANKYAAGIWKRANAPTGGLRLIEKFHAFRRGAER